MFIYKNRLILPMDRRGFMGYIYWTAVFMIGLLFIVFMVYMIKNVF